MYEFGEEELGALKTLVESKRFFRYPSDQVGECNSFEREFSAMMGSGHATLMASGTNALVSALLALGVGEGDEVIVPAYTYVATAAAVRIVGAKPVVVNIDQELGLDPKEVEQHITSRTKALLPVHMDGLSADLSTLISIARTKNLFVVEDCAQALGGQYKNRFLGTWGDMGAFSLNESKTLTCGEGGIVLTNSAELHHRAFCAHDLAARYNPTNQKTKPAFEPILGLAGRVSEFQGAIMRVQLRRLTTILKRLRQHKSILKDEVGHTDYILGHDAQGDCGTSLHLRFSDPLKAMAAFEKFAKAGIPFVYPSTRPAHVAWKWVELTNPDEAKEITDSLRASQLNLSRVLKLNTPYDLSEIQVRELGVKVKQILAVV